MENHPELLALYAGCAYAGATLFGVNSGLRGDTLAGVLNQSRARAARGGRGAAGPRSSGSRGRLQHIAPENLLVLRTQQRDVARRSATTSSACRARSRSPARSLDTPAVDVRPENNLMVIYTSGTTGLPKGINNNHVKLLIIGKIVSAQLAARRRRGRLRLHAALPLERDVPRLPAGVRGRRDAGDARALQRHRLRAGRAPLRRHLLELRRRAGPLHPRRDRARSTAATRSASARR